MPTSHAPYRNWKTTFDEKLLRLVRTSCRPLLQTWSVAFSSAWTVVANISSISSNIDMLFMKQDLLSYMHVQNIMNSLWDIRIFLGLVPKESPCTSTVPVCLYGRLYGELLAFTFFITTVTLNSHRVSFEVEMLDESCTFGLLIQCL